MTSVPKPLKYLAESYDEIKDAYNNVKNCMTRKAYADIISVLAMTTAGNEDEKYKHDCLNYCLKGNIDNVGDWGHEYIR